MLNALRRDQRGFTLIELLVAMLIGMVVLIGIMTLLDSGGRATARTLDRAEVTQRGRTAMNTITRYLRSQVCKDGSTPPIVAGTDSSVTFYTDTDTSDAFSPQAVKIWLDTTWKGGRGAVRASVYPGTDLTATPTTSALIEDVSAIPSTPFLNYYSFDTGTAITPPLSATTTGDPLPTNSVAKVLRVDVAFRVAPSVNSGASGPLSGRQLDGLRDSDFQTQVWLRNSDYTDQVAASNDRIWAARCS